MDAGVGMRAGYREVAAYRNAQRSLRLPVRVNQCLLGGPGGIVEQAFKDGVITGTGDDMLRVGPVKIFTDGSAAGVPPPCLGPSRRAGDHGLSLLTDAEMDAFVRGLSCQGLSARRARNRRRGDRADAQRLREGPDGDARSGAAHRIEHCGFNSGAQIGRMVRLGVEPVPQPVFIHDFGDLYVSVLGEARAAASYPMKTWLDGGLAAAASSDAPVCDIEPFPNLYTMLTRKTSRGTVIGGSERLSIYEALHALHGARRLVNKAEDHRGRLVPGLAADIAVFSRDMTTAAPDEILSDTAATSSSAAVRSSTTAAARPPDGTGEGTVTEATGATLYRNCDWIVAWDAEAGSHVYLRNADLAFSGKDVVFVGQSSPGKDMTARWRARSTAPG